MIGRIVKPQGLKGELLVEAVTDNPERYAMLAKVYIEENDGRARAFAVENVRSHKRRFALKLAGLDSIEAVEPYRGKHIAILESELKPLPADTYYHHALIGLRVEQEDGRGLGEVASIMEIGAGAPVVLVVRHKDQERLIPLAEPFIRRVDLAARKLIVHLLENSDAL